MLIYLRLIKESFAFAWQAIVVNKLRTLLSLLGVTVGIFSIITVFTLIDTLEHGLKDSFDMLSDDVLFVQKWPWAPEDGKEYEWWKYFQRKQPSYSNMSELKERLQYAEAVAIQVQNRKDVSYLNNTLEDAAITATSYEYNRVMKLSIAQGRYFTASEAEGARSVAIIGADVARQLFGKGQALDRAIKIGGQKLNVIGVFEKEGASVLGNGFDFVVMVPYGFAARIIDVKMSDAGIMVKAKEGVSNRQLKDEVIANFRPIRRLRPGEDNDFAVNESSMIGGFIDSIFSTVNIVGFIIGIFAIIVGGFSIANIMFVSVKERTNIIGIQKALGAKNNFILMQFLFESVALCVFGGLAGLGLIFMGVVLANSLQDSFTLGLYWSNFLTGIAISVIIGIVSGLVPAIIASRLNPVDAMRSK